MTDKSRRGNQPELRPSAGQLNGNFRIADNLATRDSFAITSALHRVNVEFGKHWSLSALA